jgi:hypothetical protein
MIVAEPRFDTVPYTAVVNSSPSPGISIYVGCVAEATVLTVILIALLAPPSLRIRLPAVAEGTM